MTLQIRWAIKAIDLEEICRIERKSHEFPWNEDEMVSALDERTIVSQVAEFNNKIIGYIVYEIFKDHYEILNLAVAPEFRRCNVAKSLFSCLHRRLNNKRQEIVTIVRESNLPALLFLKNQGFLAKKLIKNAWDELDEDAIKMVYRAP